VTVLLVEDEPDSAILMTHILELEGYRVLEARSGAEAMERIFDPDIRVALLDVMLPGMDGFEVCRRLRQDERTTRLPVASSQLVRAARSCGGIAGRRRCLFDQTDLARGADLGREVAAGSRSGSGRPRSLHLNLLPE
jgi:CheY-like chemotaxis protein